MTAKGKVKTTEVTATTFTRVLRVIAVNRTEHSYEVVMLDPASDTQVVLGLNMNQEPPRVNDGVTQRFLGSADMEVSVYSVGQRNFWTGVVIRK